MKKLLKKSLFNGFIRIILSLVTNFYTKLKTYNVEGFKYLTNNYDNSSCSNNIKSNDLVNNQKDDGSYYLANNTIDENDDDYYDDNNDEDDDDDDDDEDYGNDDEHDEDDFEKEYSANNEDKYNSDNVKSSLINISNSNEMIVYDYINESGSKIRLSSNLQKYLNNQSASKNNEAGQSQNKKYYKIRAVALCILVVIGYVSLNNYLIMLVYYKSSASTSDHSELNSASSHHSMAMSHESPFKSKNSNLDKSFLFNLNPLASLFNKYKLNNAQNNNNNKNVFDSNTNVDSNKNFYELSENYNAAAESVYKNVNSSNENLIVYIDQEDLEVAGLDKNEIIDNVTIKQLDESYFDEEEAIEDWNFNNRRKKYDENITGDYYQNNNLNGRNNSNSFKLKNKYNRPCLHPKLDPYNSEIMQFVKREEDLKCNPKKNWVYIENGRLRVSKSAIHKHGTIVCAYIPLYRGNNDFTVYEGNRIFPVMDKMPLITDFFKIDCRSKDGAIYSNIHSGIAYESSLQMRHIWNPMPKKALGYNVLMFGFDSVSRMSWIRMLPKSYEYMIKEGFIVLKGYNIVGDGTPQALLPILTGKKETELPEARRGFTNASYVDGFPWIWNDYKKAGYVTQWAEDMQSIGTFQLRMLGFKKQPVDHYMRVFYLEAERYYSRFRRLCLGSISRHKNIFNWVKEFFSTYSNQPKFSFIFHSEASHNYNNPLSLLDNDLKEFLVYLKKSGIMEKTIMLFMSDHGVRVSDLRQYSQGKLEERMPFFSLLMPRTFQKKYPNEMRNLRLNSKKLTTPFDIHETLMHFLNFETSTSQSNKFEKRNADSNNQQKMPRGISLLKYISPNRSCEDAQIEAHWCSCLNWIELNIKPSSSTAINYEKEKDFEELFNEDLSGDKKSVSTTNIPLLSSDSSTVLTNVSNKNVLNFDEYKQIRQSLKKYSKSALKVAQKSVEYINQLIDTEFKVYCEKIRLHSIQRISKLDLNLKLLLFKESKDIHGREALFNKLDNLTNSTFDSHYNIAGEYDFLKPLNLNLNKTKLEKQANISNSSSLNSNQHDLFVNTETTFQIVLTTWPGNSTYELSFKYNLNNGAFKFNKNEISRINNYNATSSCMTNKRPDLRQFCYCKYN